MFHLQDAKSADDRINALERFIEFWVGRRQPHYGEPDDVLAMVELPRPLQRLYRFAGRWLPDRFSNHPQPPAHMFCVQDELLELAALHTSADGKLVFLRENQSVWHAATECQGEDPPVWISEDRVGPPWQLACDSLSKFLVTHCLQELFFGSRCTLSDEVALEPIRSELEQAEPLWIDGLYAMTGPYNFYLLGTDCLVADSVDGKWISANSDRGVAFLKSLENQILRITIETPSEWFLEIRPDGSATLFYFRVPAARAQVPPGTFDFEELVARLYATPGVAQIYNVFTLTFSPRPHSRWPVPQSDKLRGIFSLAISRAISQEPRFHEMLRSRPPC